MTTADDSARAPWDAGDTPDGMRAGAAVRTGDEFLPEEEEEAGPRRPRQAPRQRPPRLRRLAGQWPLVLILAGQAALSLRLTGANTAYMDEALYLWAGHQEWAHWLHGALIQNFPSYFSGAPVIYPPLGALADTAGGLHAARLLSLCFMLAATAALWVLARRLFGQRAAFFAAGIWAVLAPTQILGAYATYDAMALFLLAVSACCAASARDRAGVRWMIAAAGTLALANLTKYATMLFDPVILGLAVLAGLPAGRRVARGRAIGLLAASGGAGFLVVAFSGSQYIQGMERTTLFRFTATDPVSKILTGAWQATAVVLIASLVAVGISFFAARPPTRWLLALLAVAGLLVPLEQARIHTYTSLTKHLDFGAWFAAIAAGYAVNWILERIPARPLRYLSAAVCGLLLIPLAQYGAGLAVNGFFAGWPNASKLIPVVRHYTAHGGNFFADDTSFFEYYVPSTSWQQWTSIYTAVPPPGEKKAVTPGNLRRYLRPEGSPVDRFRAVLAAYRFRVVVLTFQLNRPGNVAISRYMARVPGYRLVYNAGWDRYGHPAGRFLVWVYRGRYHPPRRHGTAPASRHRNAPVPPRDLARNGPGARLR